MSEIHALLFDVFGTVVDWRGTIIEEGQVWTTSHQINVDWANFADEWRGGYQPALDVIRRGEAPWIKLNIIHRRILDRLLEKYQIDGLRETEIDQMNRVWHRLRPWPDTIPD